MSAHLRAVSWYAPSQVVSNDALGRENPDWDMSRIGEKVGIRQRHIAAENETSADLAYKAAERLLEAGLVDRASIDALIFCTQTPDHVLPASACILQERLGLGTSLAAFDFNQGCSGYIYGLGIAKGLIAAGIASNVLLLTGETYSKLVHPRDRTVRVLFGDAGTASLISSHARGAAIGELVLGTDGRGAKNLIVPAGGFRQPASDDTAKEQTDELGCVRTAENLFMDGKEITSFALSTVPTLISQLLEKSGETAESIDQYVFHQANSFMNNRLRVRLTIPAEKVPTHLADVGNTVGNTIPIVLGECGGSFKPGARVMLVGFGVGYSWGATLLEWGDVSLITPEGAES